MSLNSPVQTTTGPGGQQFQYQLQGLPTAQNTSTSTSLTGDAAKQNLAAAPDLTSLTDLINTLNRNAQTSANAARIPNNPALEQASSGNIANLLAGQIPADVINNLSQTAAERGVAMGSPGSDNSNAGLLRALGLTSLDLQQLGQQNLSAADARNPGAPIFNPGSMLLTPGQLGQLNNAAGFLGLDWYKALHPNLGGGGGGRNPYNPNPESGGGGVGNPNWWQNLMGGTPSPQAPPPYAQAPPGTLTTSNNVSYNNPANPSGGGFFSSNPSNPTGVGYDITSPGYGVGYDLGGGFGFNPIFDPTGGVGYNQTSPFSGGYTAPSTGMGDLFGGLSGVGYDQTYNPFSQYDEADLSGG